MPMSLRAIQIALTFFWRFPSSRTMFLFFSFTNTPELDSLILRSLFILHTYMHAEIWFLATCITIEGVMGHRTQRGICGVIIGLYWLCIGLFCVWIGLFCMSVAIKDCCAERIGEGLTAYRIIYISLLNESCHMLKGSCVTVRRSVCGW